MQEIKNHTKVVYFIAHNGKDVFHYGEVGIQNQMGTGQPTLEQFDTEQEMKDRYFELTGNQITE